ncbi:unnamed protein product [Sphenostylis stenocarpa]|uniref:Uncharacterized protein n=1 Tax=Sphenostylis stenocarpa TaxID=92480 RepID=A0AA86W4J1_9FABA|nr:unnamed protein product [Sphenostylis stenocarpa]
MFPWFAIGHITPFVHLSNELAKRGHRVTFLIPPKALIQVQHLNSYPHLITFYPLTIPHVEGLPHGTETVSDIDPSLTKLVVTVMDKTRDQVEQIIGAKQPDFIFFDTAHWIPQIAKKLGIKSIFYSVICAASLAIVYVPARNVPKDRPITVEELSQPPEGYPSSKLVLTGPEAKLLLFISATCGEGNIRVYDRVTTAFRESDALAIRTTREMEGSICDYLGSQYGKKVLLTGPVLPEDAEGRLEENLANWLDGFAPGSVVYCAFGSQMILEKEQFQELLLGFELSGLPFLVALKTPKGCESLEEALPEGFESRVKGRGMVSRGWVQQLLILKHPSVGCFVNHCGFGSMWESLMSDKQIVLVPHLADQILNTKLLVGELEVAVEVKKREDGWVSKESLSQAIKSVMDEKSEVGAKVKNNHKKWRDDGGNQKLLNSYIDTFVQEPEDFSPTE